MQKPWVAGVFTLFGCGAIPADDVTASSFPAAAPVEKVTIGTTADMAGTTGNAFEASDQNSSVSTVETTVPTTQLSAANPPLQPSTVAVTFFRRALPSPPAIAFASQEGTSPFTLVE